jgi:hypothetical protein
VGASRQNEVHLNNGMALVFDGRARIKAKLVMDQPKPWAKMVPTPSMRRPVDVKAHFDFLLS